MSAKALSYVWDHSPYTGTKRVIHLAVADVANEENNNRLWVSQGSISRKAKCDRKTVTRAFAEMVGDGYLKLIKDNSAARNPNVYEFLMPYGDISSHRDISSQDRDISSRTIGTSDPLMVTKCPTNSITQVEKNSITSAFERFWRVYPRKINKKKAFECFEKAAARADCELIADRAAVWAKAWKDAGQETQFIPHATTWLNADRWEDEPEKITAKSELQGNAQFGKSYLGFEYEDGRDLAEKLGAKVYGKPRD